MTRALYVLLGAVALAAAVLSFAALRDLALLCGFSRSLAWLLPVVVDAGAAGGSLVWLGGHAPTQARRFAQRLALVLLGLSISANALGHVLAQSGGPAPAWVVAVASGVAPAVLAALIHLGVLCGRAADSKATAPGMQSAGEIEPPPAPSSDDEPPAGGELVAPVLPDPPSRDEPDAVLVADLRVVDATRRAEGLGPLPIGDRKTGIRARYGVGYPRGSKLRRAADEPAPTRPHLVPPDERDEESA